MKKYLVAVLAVVMLSFIAAPIVQTADAAAIVAAASCQRSGSSFTCALADGVTGVTGVTYSTTGQYIVEGTWTGDVVVLVTPAQPRVIYTQFRDTGRVDIFVRNPSYAGDPADDVSAFDILIVQ